MTQPQAVRVCMVRRHMHDLPQAPLPPGYVLRTYQPGDERHWLAIEESAEAGGVWDQAAFLRQYGHDLPAVRDRCFFIVDAAGQFVGTSTGWYENDFYGRRWGRVHWVAIVPQHQGRGLARPLMSATMNRLANSHTQAYLFTHTFRVPAIKLYLNYGFQPLVQGQEDLAGWRQLSRTLPHPLLNEPFITPTDL